VDSGCTRIVPDSSEEVRESNRAPVEAQLREGSSRGLAREVGLGDSGGEGSGGVVEDSSEGVRRRNKAPQAAQLKGKVSRGEGSRPSGGGESRVVEDSSEGVRRSKEAPQRAEVMEDSHQGLEAGEGLGDMMCLYC